MITYLLQITQRCSQTGKHAHAHFRSFSQPHSEACTLRRVCWYRGLRVRLHEVLPAFLCPIGGQLEPHAFWVLCEDSVVNYEIMCRIISGWQCHVMWRAIWSLLSGLCRCLSAVIRLSGSPRGIQLPRHNNELHSPLINHWCCFQTMNSGKFGPYIFRTLSGMPQRMPQQQGWGLGRTKSRCHWLLSDDRINLGVHHPLDAIYHRIFSQPSAYEWTMNNLKRQ